MKAPMILDCTLRDGSYVNNFQFTQKDTESISGDLDKAGFPYIEVGHGIGLGATEKGPHKAACSDIQYMRAARKSVKKNKWGMFCIPGIATLDHVRLAADEGMDFIRIGTDVTEVSQSQPFIELALKNNIEVFSNFMKSYVLEPEEFGSLVIQARSYGSQMVYLVDSAGGMLPNEVKNFIEAAKDMAPDVPLGFHGHNNLGLGVANSLICSELGVDMVDTSLQGYGRSAGNTGTEQLISTLIRAGFDTEISSLEVMQLGEIHIRPLIDSKGISSLDIAAGEALFHSSYMSKVVNIAVQKKVDPRALIIELCKINKIEAPIELVKEIAKKLQSTNPAPINIPFKKYYGEEQS
mgnify:FL=1|jgi:4-hydroxy-2-oxovalerate aldolase|tara:strand:- start:5870 stop:6922 length:1053 start_codon:yes stop_codon:yes gene_type:complete